MNTLIFFLVSLFHCTQYRFENYPYCRITLTVHVVVEWIEKYKSNIRIYSEISKLRIEYLNIFVWSKINIHIRILYIQWTIFKYPNIFEYSSITGLDVHISQEWSKNQPSSWSIIIFLLLIHIIIQFKHFYYFLFSEIFFFPSCF